MVCPPASQSYLTCAAVQDGCAHTKTWYDGHAMQAKMAQALEAMPHKAN